jgi:hypothetical protein
MMPLPSIWMIRLSLLYLLISVIIGAILLTNKALVLHPAIWAFLPIHYELAIWGWLVQFVMGTAYWMFPKYLKQVKRGSVTLAWLMIVTFNIGLYILILSLILRINGIIRISGRSLLMLSVIIFGLLMWRRIVSYRELKTR